MESIGARLRERRRTRLQMAFDQSGKRFAGNRVFSRLTWGAPKQTCRLGMNRKATQRELWIQVTSEMLDLESWIMSMKTNVKTVSPIRWCWVQVGNLTCYLTIQIVVFANQTLLHEESSSHAVNITLNFSVVKISENLSISRIKEKPNLMRNYTAGDSLYTHLVLWARRGEAMVTIEMRSS